MLVRLGGIIGVIGLVIWLYTIFDSITAPSERIRSLPKGLWVLIVLIFALLGSALWFIFGRPYRVVSGAPGTALGSEGGSSFFGNGETPPAPTPRAHSGSGSAWGTRRSNRGPVRGLGPDDDPEFLQKLSDDLRRDGQNGRDGAPDAE